MLDCLPTVQKCCFCINLKWGSFLIAIISLLSLGLSGFSAIDSSECIETNIFRTIWRYTTYAAVAIQIVVFVASIALIIGIFARYPVTATWFIYAVLAAIIVYVVFLIISIISGITNKICGFPGFDIASSAISVLIWLYFIIVVKSYQPEM